ncbi:MAG: hypothetical protein ABJI69_13210 [Balneola sp.]
MSLTLEQIAAREIVRHREFMADLNEVKQMKQVIENEFLNRNQLASFLGYSSGHSFTQDAEKRLQAKGYIPKHEKGYSLKDAKILKREMIKGNRRVQISKIKKKTGS